MPNRFESLAGRLVVLLGITGTAGTAAGTTIDLPATVPCITSAAATVTVPISLNGVTNPTGRGARGFTATVQLSSGLKFGGATLGTFALLTAFSNGCFRRAVQHGDRHDAIEHGSAGHDLSHGRSGDESHSDAIGARLQQFFDPGDLRALVSPRTGCLLATMLAIRPPSECPPSAAPG